MIREPEVYHDLITTLFQDYQIPIFVDEKRTMLNHPLIETVRSLLDVIEGNWRYDAVFRLLKAGFIPEGDGENKLDQEAIDELENYVLEYGVRGRSRWLSEKHGSFNALKDLINPHKPIGNYPLKTGSMPIANE
ncbi:ATP-dependent nuclease [Gracilibacillus boraciitolerans JCM 21714]|uniref:ATP-dependent nuclease n=1 Tax=Gracilibacillus boraciitolerans JCM 21714 TaxID=1298598 RepID=W4VK92_9BACI|nr:ATP-dependent nuclease [Gracilibacillus boraciitolerans JCM 21714]